MGQILILLVVALVAAALVFGVVTLITGGDQGLEPVEPDGSAVPLPVSRPLTEVDLTALRFDTAMRGYRMAQVDQALRRAAYDLGYKEELINVLEAEVAALREGRVEDAEALRKARESAARPAVPGAEPAVVPDAPVTAEPGEADDAVDSDGSAGPPVDRGDGDAGGAPVEVSVVSGPAGEKADAQQ
jgi:DivIVA domain-containing protein